LFVLAVYFGFFFFQAEDGIRAGHVTGVQTCALPISLNRRSVGERVAERHADLDEVRARGLDELERRERRFGGGMARGEVRDERRTAPAPCPQGAPARGDRVLRQSDR